MHLYEISEEMRRAILALEVAQEEGDPAAYEAAMDAISKATKDRDQKLNDCCNYHRELEAELEAVTVEHDRLAARKKSLTNKVEEWKKYIGMCLGVGESWKNGVYKLYWKKSTAVKIVNEEAIPHQWLVETISYRPDKRTIEADIKAGATIPGVELEQRQNLQIR